MKTAYHYINFVVKLLVGILLLPFWVLYVVTKYMVFKYTFNKQLKFYGVDKDTAKILAKELNIFLPHKFINRKQSPAKQ